MLQMTSVQVPIPTAPSVALLALFAISVVGIMLAAFMQIRLHAEKEYCTLLQKDLAEAQLKAQKLAAVIPLNSIPKESKNGEEN